MILRETHPGNQLISTSSYVRSITLRHLRVIAELADLKSVARVSEALDATQPAVSKQIAELEKIVGLPVVTHERNRLHLTPVGRTLADHARLVLNQLDKAAFDIEAMASGLSGSVSIGVVTSVAPTLLPGAISMFKRSAPEANISIVEGHFVEMLPEMESGSLDVLIARTWHPKELPGIDQIALFSEPVLVVAGRDHPLAKKSDLTWPDLSTTAWILPQANSIGRQAIDDMFARNGLTPPSNTIASSSLALNLELLQTIPAVGFLPQHLAQSHSARGELARLPLNTQGLLSEARCYWCRDNILQNGTVSLFLKCLQQAADDLKTIRFG